MKTIIKNINLTAILILVFFSAFSQADVQENNYSQLQNTMTVDRQTTYNLVGFEGRAIQKTEEFAGYLEIISNKEYEMTLRKHAINTAVKLFFRDWVNIENSDVNISKLKIISLNDYIDLFLNTKYTKITVEITDCEFKENLKSDKSDSYKGKLEFNQTNKFYNNSSISDKTTERKEVEIILVKTTKEFGKKTKNVWTVFLGEIRAIKE